MAALEDQVFLCDVTSLTALSFNSITSETNF